MVIGIGNHASLPGSVVYIDPSDRRFLLAKASDGNQNTPVHAYVSIRIKPLELVKTLDVVFLRREQYQLSAD
jgi:hypothetical protein